MKENRTLVVNLRLDGRILALVGVLALISVLVYSVAVAQEGQPPTTNDASMAPAADVAQPEPLAVPDSPEGQDASLVYTTNGEWVPRDSLGAPVSAPDGAAISAATGAVRHVYLTKTTYATNHALTACAAGYHMASLWELYDISNIAYDRNHPQAYNKTDSGYGPPSFWYGWVRTGYDSSSSSTTGTGNCNNWSSISNSVNGVSVRLSHTWETAPGEMGPWDATSFTCNYTGPVWCVKD